MTRPDVAALAAALVDACVWHGMDKEPPTCTEAIIAALAAQNVYLVTAETLTSALEAVADHPVGVFNYETQAAATLKELSRG